MTPSFHPKAALNTAIGLLKIKAKDPDLLCFHQSGNKRFTLESEDTIENV